jgi:hypothetical protein
MSLFTYRGPLSALTLPNGTEVVLFPGCTVDLPPGPVYEDLNALKRLTPYVPPALPDPVPDPIPEPTPERVAVRSSRGARSSFPTRTDALKGGAE